jgi:cell wall-associated NlpC family hydrolase
LVDLLRSPNGPRERQLWLGEGFIVVDRDAGHAFGFAEKDGYCGWLPDAALEDGPPSTHWVASAGTHLYPEPKSSSKELAALPMGARLSVIGQVGKYAETSQGYVPASHLLPLGQHLTDPVAVAEMFQHSPYLWGGNSRAGLDCSGLCQIAHHACGIAVPGDADLQEMAGSVVQGEFQRGDLLFWPGHVAIAVDALRLIHANGHTMSVAYEGIQDAIVRIEASEGYPLRSHQRL